MYFNDFITFNKECKNTRVRFVLYFIYLDTQSSTSASYPEEDDLYEIFYTGQTEKNKNLLAKLKKTHL